MPSVQIRHWRFLPRSHLYTVLTLIATVPHTRLLRRSGGPRNSPDSNRSLFRLVYIHVFTPGWTDSFLLRAPQILFMLLRRILETVVTLSHKLFTLAKRFGQLRIIDHYRLIILVLKRSILSVLLISLNFFFALFNDARQIWANRIQNSCWLDPPQSESNISRNECGPALLVLFSLFSLQILNLLQFISCKKHFFHPWRLLLRLTL